MPSRFFAVTLSAALLLAGCSDDSPTGGAIGIAGAAPAATGGRGGAPGTGGGASTGTGGAAGTGGSGGAAGSAGASGTGGGAGAPARDGATIADVRPDAGARDGGAADGATSAGPFALTSAAFKEGGDVALMYRCRTENVSPPLAWTAGPPGTLGYAVTLAHNTTPHWALWDIAAATTALPMGIARAPMPPDPAGSKQARPNVDGSTWYGYSGPCPGGPNQEYQFVVYALKVATLPGVTPDSPIRDVIAAINAQTLARATLLGHASR
jgi:phosphatidylethanolamine-binding protein (PEBP) family uncharacterized protein